MQLVRRFVVTVSESWIWCTIRRTSTFPRSDRSAVTPCSCSSTYDWSFWSTVWYWASTLRPPWAAKWIKMVPRMSLAHLFMGLRVTWLVLKVLSNFNKAASSDMLKPDRPSLTCLASKASAEAISLKFFRTRSA